ncbi:MAG: hypothetical protein KZQ80_14700 [Candidatus Thiodiazotropha sp. (ex Monitilora ramsayi)]|nr:hypothetical protein [Candidatus Thiodiazotropha sp. (ex Monitilora ramsayi)]
MRGVGLGMLMARLRNNGPMEKCSRCGLNYSAKEEYCPHCNGMSEVELDEFKEKIARQRDGHKSLGNIFYIAAIVLFALIVVIVR